MDKKIVVLIIGMLLLTFVSVYLINNMNKNKLANLSEEINEFNINAFRFDYEPNEIRVKQGDRVRLVVDNADTIHGIRIPDFNLKGDKEIEFIADKKGEFMWYCANYCGESHREMQGKIIVE